MDSEQLPPVKEKETVRLTIENFGTKGDPFGKVNNFVVFLSSRDPDKYQKGSTYTVTITRVCEKFAFAEPMNE